jgi:hypothetical protein
VAEGRIDSLRVQQPVAGTIDDVNGQVRAGREKVYLFAYQREVERGTGPEGEILRSAQSDNWNRTQNDDPLAGSSDLHVRIEQKHEDRRSAHCSTGRVG